MYEPDTFFFFKHQSGQPYTCILFPPFKEVVTKYDMSSCHGLKNTVGGLVISNLNSIVIVFFQLFYSIKLCKLSDRIYNLCVWQIGNVDSFRVLRHYFFCKKMELNSKYFLLYVVTRASTLNGCEIETFFLCSFVYSQNMNSQETDLLQIPISN